MTTTLHERLTFAMEARGVHPSLLAREVGVSAQSVTYWMRGDTTPRRGAIEKICAYLRIQWQWLERGIGDMDAANTPSDVGKNMEKHPDSGGDFSSFDIFPKRKVPLVELEDLIVSQGALGVVDATSVNQFIESMFPTSIGSHAFTMGNSSMSPAVEPGDIVVIDPDVELFPGDMVAVRLLRKSQNIFRRYTQGTNGEVILVPINPDWEVLKFTADEWKVDVEILGVTAWVAKRARRG